MKLNPEFVSPDSRRASRLRRANRLALLVGLGIFPLSNCICPDDEFIKIAPTIYVDVCKDPETKIDGEDVGGYENCELVFGEEETIDGDKQFVSAISVDEVRDLKIANPSTVDLEIESIELTTDSDPAFEIKGSVPKGIEAGLTNLVLVQFRPRVESEVEGRLVIKSDAQNVPEGQDVIIDIVGNGIDKGIPDVDVEARVGDDVTPRTCDFGRVATGSVKQCEVTVTNSGARDLVFDEVYFASDYDGQVYPIRPAGSTSTEPPFSSFGRLPQEDDLVPAPPENNKVPLSIKFLPDALGPYAGKLIIVTNDPNEPEIVVDLMGEGVDPPLCVVRIESVNGIAVGDTTPTIEPLDDVILSVADSEPSTPTGFINEINWTITRPPVGSTVHLTNPSGPGATQTGFSFADKFGVDLAGRYRVSVIIVDDLGTESVNPCELEFEAIPTDSILAQLSWDTATGDMDLHVVKMFDGEFCANSVVAGPVAVDCGFGGEGDCYYGNCKATNNECPDWDGTGSDCSDGDPSLDIDDLSGYGPENTNIDLAQAGQYLVAVDYYSGSVPANNTVRLYLYGQLSAEWNRVLDGSDWWEVAIVHWNADGSYCIEDLSPGATNDCP